MAAQSQNWRVGDVFCGLLKDGKPLGLIVVSDKSFTMSSDDGAQALKMVVKL